MLRLISGGNNRPDYLRHDTVPGIVEYRKDLGRRARLWANLITVTAIVLPCAMLVILLMNYTSPFEDNYILFGFTIASLAAAYALFRYQQRLRGGIAANLVRIDTNQQLLSVGLNDEQVHFEFNEVQEILLISRKRNTGLGPVVPSRFSYSIDLWTTDDTYYPLMEPLWQIDVPVRVEYEQMARDITQDIRDLIRRSLIITKSQQNIAQPLVFLEEN